jgi:hypothetical protein
MLIRSQRAREAVKSRGPVLERRTKKEKCERDQKNLRNVTMPWSHEYLWLGDPSFHAHASGEMYYISEDADIMTFTARRI